MQRPTPPSRSPTAAAHVRFEVHVRPGFIRIERAKQRARAVPTGGVRG